MVDHVYFEPWDTIFNVSPGFMIGLSGNGGTLLNNWGYGGPFYDTGTGLQYLPTYGFIYLNALGDGEMPIP